MKEVCFLVLGTKKSSSCGIVHESDKFRDAAILFHSANNFYLCLPLFTIARLVGIWSCEVVYFAGCSAMDGGNSLSVEAADNGGWKVRLFGDLLD